MENIAVLAITKNGVKIGKRLKELFHDWKVFAPSKFKDGSLAVTWYEEPTSQKIADLFCGSDGLVCLFSLGAVVRLVAPYIKDKKTDPAVIVIDDAASFVISVLSGHIGGANELAIQIAQKLGAQPVITTAADVNKTISVDLIGRDLGWKIEDDSAVTRVSAHMVNQEPIGVFQDAGSKSWYTQLPKNVIIYDTPSQLRDSGSRAHLIISDQIHKDVPDSVIYRPPSLVVGVGLHSDTTKDKILGSIRECLDGFKLSPKSIAQLASIKKPKDVQGLIDAGETLGVPVSYIQREQLAKVEAPNPSSTVDAFEGTPSVSEAAAILASRGTLIVEKQKFPPDLTIAIARMRN